MTKFWADDLPTFFIPAFYIPICIFNRIFHRPILFCEFYFKVSHRTKDTCFIYNEKRPYDANDYNSGRLGRCSDDRACSKILAQKEVYPRDTKSKFYAAVFRL